MPRFPQHLRERIIPIRGIMGYCHILLEEDGKRASLLDTGLFGETYLIKRALKKRGLRPCAIKTILLTHGHLDHSGNLEELKRLSGAKVFAHPMEQGIINGNFPYTGINSWCGKLEELGRKVLHVGKPADIDVGLGDNMELPIFDGLRVVHLPGHTLGHCGFYSKKHSLLFCGDLFASYALFYHLPPAILNTAPDMIRESLRKAWDLEADFVVPQHFDIFSPSTHKRRLEELFYREIGGSCRAKIGTAAERSKG